MKVFADTELILNEDGSVYHLRVKAGNIADTVLLVGDPGRVELVSSRFDQITFKSANREFICHTGLYNGQKLSVLSTGIGPDNIDIVVNELDAAVNIDPVNRMQRSVTRQLNLIRLGTCGSLQQDVPVNNIVISSHGIGLDGLINFYGGAFAACEEDITQSFIRHTGWSHRLPYPYCVAADAGLFRKFSEGAVAGITATAPGFYGPQGRELRLAAEMENLNDLISSFQFRGNRIVNFEMETSALYGLGKLLGHHCLTLCVVIANRITKEFSADHHQSVGKLIDYTLNNISQLHEQTTTD